MISYSYSVQFKTLCSTIFRLLGVQSHETESGLVISSGESRDFTLGIDVSDIPDLFQTLTFTLVGLGKKYSFSGLSTLRVKETDRIAAVCSQLNKVRVQSRFLADDVLFFDASDLKTDGTVIFESFDDHRMAMSAAVISTVM
ncbi:MAG: hypothetical protein KDC13_08115 [Bacteroidetes bacterium]|nr:hypothetical protein [Bacteroidota bacterium]